MYLVPNAIFQRPTICKNGKNISIVKMFAKPGNEVL